MVEAQWEEFPKCKSSSFQHYSEFSYSINGLQYKLNTFARAVHPTSVGIIVPKSAISQRNGWGVALVVSKYIFLIKYFKYILIQTLADRKLFFYLGFLQIYMSTNETINNESTQEVPFQTSFGLCRLWKYSLSLLNKIA